jgi:tRNA dimethylallyltransferase
MINSVTMNKLIVILGPTASGKTQLAIKLASKFRGEIISADSRQIYQGMDIGTGKDMESYQGLDISCHLIDIRKPNEQLSLAEYKKLASQTINSIIKRGNLPFLVGGTGLYISALVDNYQIPVVKPNQKIRLKLEKLSQTEKIKMLKRLDPKALTFVDINNPRRLNRALEVCLAGKKFSQTRKKGKPRFETLMLGIKISHSSLASRINKRVDKMIERGLVKETKDMIKRYGATLLPLQTIGYAEIINYLNKKTSLGQAIELIKLHTRQFARRQMTWFGRDKRIIWITNYSQAEIQLRKFLN